MPISESHVLILRVTGVLFLCSGLFSWCTSDAYDATIALSVALSRVLVCKAKSYTYRE